jgi:sec-independent protein translocase protein TatB
MLGLTFDKVLIIGVIAVFVLGPERLPHYAAQFARLVRGARDMASGAKERVRGEMGPEYDEIDWKKLDPRQFDPRRIIREALLDDSPARPQPPNPPPSQSPNQEQARPPHPSDRHELSGLATRREKVAATPFDTEST